MKKIKKYTMKKIKKYKMKKILTNDSILMIIGGI